MDAKNNNPTPTTPRILLVDDMETNLYAATGLIQKYDLEADSTTSGQEAIDRIRAKTPEYSAIFMDHMMPGVDGIEATQAIRALETEYAKNIPIIALTGSADASRKQLYYENGFQDILYKPIDVDLLDAILKKWVSGTLEQKKQTDAGQQPGADGIDIDIPGVDAQTGLARYSGDIGVYVSVLRSYASSTPPHLNKLRLATSETLPECAIVAHGLKGAGASICAENTKAAAELEKAARNGDLTGFLERLDPFLHDTERLTADVGAWLEEYDTINKKPRLNAPDRATLQKLLQSCEAYEISGVDEAMDELESASYDTDADLVTWLREKLDIMEVDEVVAKLTEKLR